MCYNHFYEFVISFGLFFYELRNLHRWGTPDIFLANLALEERVIYFRRRPLVKQLINDTLMVELATTLKGHSLISIFQEIPTQKASSVPCFWGLRLLFFFHYGLTESIIDLIYIIIWALWALVLELLERVYECSEQNDDVVNLPATPVLRKLPYPVVFHHHGTVDALIVVWLGIRAYLDMW